MLLIISDFKRNRGGESFKKLGFSKIYRRKYKNVSKFIVLQEYIWQAY